MPSTPARLAVLASGDGSNLQAILEYFDAVGESPPADVALVASNVAGAFALERARRRGIAVAEIRHPSDGGALESLLEVHRVGLVALAGYLKRVPVAVVRRWRGAIVNVHPALLPKFGGAGMYGRRVHEAVLAAGERESGATVHFVDEEYDHGATIARAAVPVEPGDTPESLAARVRAVEHQLYPRALHALAIGLVSMTEDGRVARRHDPALAGQIPPSSPPIALEFAGAA